jgi:hypothetical protein
VVVELPSRQILGGRRDLDDVRLVPRAAERDVGISEHEIHVGRQERLAALAGLPLLDQPQDRRVPLRKSERRVGRLSCGGCRQAGEERREEEAEPPSARSHGTPAGGTTG